MQLDTERGQDSYDVECIRKPTIYFRPFFTESFGDKLLKLEVKLADYLMSLDYTNTIVTHLSNPLEHARYLSILT